MYYEGRLAVSYSENKFTGTCFHAGRHHTPPPPCLPTCVPTYLPPYLPNVSSVETFKQYNEIQYNDITSCSLTPLEPLSMPPSA